MVYSIIFNQLCNAFLNLTALKLLSTTLFLVISQTLFAQSPDYAKLEFWAAHPDKKDASDLETDLVKTKNVDVFYIYPTIYTQPNFTDFSASLSDQKLNAEIEATAIFHQARTFSGLANIYAPFYRQM